MLLKERLAVGMRVGTAIGAMYLFGGQSSENNPPDKTFAIAEQMIQDGDYSNLIQNNTPDDQSKLQLIIDMMAETKTGTELLQFLKANGTTMSFNNPSSEDGGASYRKETNSIQIRRNAFKDTLPLLWVLSHEAEHARHMTLEDQKGYSAHSSLNDSYIATTIHESLAERSGSSVTLEYLTKHPELRSELPTNFSLDGKNLDNPEMRIEALKGMIYNLDLEQQKGKSLSEITKDVFNRRMSIDQTPGWDATWKRYEKNAFISGDNIPQRTMQDWDKIVSDISIGQVSEIKSLPVVSDAFAWKCISSEIEKNPNASSLNELNLSCLKKNKGKTQLDENSTKNMVISSLFEAQTQQDIPPELSSQIKGFLGVELSDRLKDNMGWTDCSQDSEYIEKTNLAKINLEKYSAKDCLNKMSTLFNTPEGQSFLEKQGTSSEISKNVKTVKFMQEFSAESSLSVSTFKTLKNCETK